jgi:hypothetical protein
MMLLSLMPAAMFGTTVVPGRSSVSVTVESAAALTTALVTDETEAGAEITLVLEGTDGFPTSTIYFASSRGNVDEFFYRRGNNWVRLYTGTTGVTVTSIGTADAIGGRIYRVNLDEIYTTQGTMETVLRLKIQSSAPGPSRIGFTTNDHNGGGAVGVAGADAWLRANDRTTDSPNLIIGENRSHRVEFTAPTERELVISGGGGATVLANNIAFRTIEATVTAGGRLVSGVQVNFSIVGGVGGRLWRTSHTTDLTGVASTRRTTVRRKS